MKGPITGEVSVTINSDPPLSGRNQNAAEEFEPFNGQIRMLSTDGAEFILSANPDSQISTEPGALLVDLVTQRADGSTVVSDGIPLINITSSRIADHCFIDEEVSDDCGAIVLP